jgi:M6 family metalloprotease-like protein
VLGCPRTTHGRLSHESLTVSFEPSLSEENITMSRRTLTVAGGAAISALLATAFTAPATATPSAAGPSSAPAAEKLDDRSDGLEAERRDLGERATELVVSGDREVQDRGGSQAVKIAPGQWAQYGQQSSDNILTFLVEFGDQEDPRAGTDIDPDPEEEDIFPAIGTGPEHNQIPKPDRSVDNTTYWTEDFDRAHFMDMFFGSEGESFNDVYQELSSGRYSVGGDVSKWVKVPYNEASYGYTESQTDMTRFIDDGAEAWYDQQVAQGKTDEQIKAYLAEFDKWDRFDWNNNGDFKEPDGYIDHFQAVHAGEDESAGAPAWAIWAHRWAVNQSGFYEDGDGPTNYEENGGIEIGDTGFWIRDYTTEPENGGLGVFAHEYAHDLGLPDLYDTSGGENGTGFWTLMSSGSWLGHGADTIGTTPNHMGAWEKLRLGWLDYEMAKTGTESTHELGPSYHATKKAQAVLVELPKDAQGKSRYYIAENRQYAGYDTTLAEGPYNFGWTLTQPDRVEHFPYQDGLSITYWNTAQTNNRTRVHPGEGLVLPVDAHPAALRWSDGAVARNRIQTYDASFGLGSTDPISLHRETAEGMTTIDLPSRPAVRTFDDSDPNAYYDPANPMGSVRVAGTGTKIRVVQINPRGMMTIEVQ